MADSIEGAKAVLEQVRSRPLEEHDLYVQLFMRKLGGDLYQRSLGEPCTPALQQEVDELCWACLDEACGEGYHRYTSQEHTRAPGGSSMHLKRHPRFHQELERLKKFQAMGERGREVVNYEWSNRKRVLQTKWERRWQPKQVTEEMVFKKLYHEDEMAAEDWTLITHRLPPERRVVPKDQTNRSRLEDEYISATIRPGDYYGTPDQEEDVGPDGQPVSREVLNVWQLVSVRGSHSRPHTMPTYETADDPVHTANHAVEVQPMQQQVRDEEGRDAPVVNPPPDHITVFEDADSFWAPIRRLGDFDTLSRSLWTWTDAVASVDTPGCMELSGLRKAKPSVPSWTRRVRFFAWSTL